jgi:nitrite reductase/ring-hydroxylating ferredoxin subunit
MTDSSDAEELAERGYTPVCDTDDLQGVMPTPVELNGRTLLICQGDSNVFAVDEMCPHKNRSMRYGVVRGDSIICPHHRYVFNLESGRCRRRRCAPVEVYDTQVRDETVWVRVVGSSEDTTHD